MAVGLIGLVALAAVVLGMLWLVQFILRNEEKGRG